MSRYKSPNGTGRVGRDKKKKALESDEYAENIKKLVSKGINPEDIESIYNKCQTQAKERMKNI